MAELNTVRSLSRSSRAALVCSRNSFLSDLELLYILEQVDGLG